MGSLHTDMWESAPAMLRPRETQRGPLSFGQQRLWFLDRWLAGRPVYNMPITLRFSGPLDAERLAGAVRAVAARHDVLFTVFEEGPNGPLQRVSPDRGLPCPVTDLTGTADARARARQAVEQYATRPFDLARGALLRAHLFRLADDEHWLQLTFHHIACDGWSLEVFQRQLTEAYRAGGVPSAALPVQYADYALWQRDTAQAAADAGALNAWTTALSGAPAVLDLGADRPRPAELSYRGAVEHVQLGDVPPAALERFAADAGVTPYVVLLAAFQALVARHSGGDDVVLGSPTAGRGPAALDEMVGFFADSLVIRTSLAGDPTFRALVVRTRAGVLDALTRGRVPFDMAVNHLHPKRDLGYSPVVQVVFALHEDDGPATLDDGVTVERSAVPTGTAKYDLTWSVFRGAQGLRLEVEYATDLFDAATIRVLAGHWETLLRRVLDDPDRPLSEIDPTPEDEAARIGEWSCGGVGVSGAAT
ncbi:condensation domain-containing protein, partial [Micromonospora sp. LOL_014]|uniref:condensation domain-containing protein n=1 Tax=Micromonospora sp. LOL_014 TaxID=3345415 RepID=UPI003A84B253